MCRLAISAIQGWGLHQMDVNNAFLYGDLDEDVYMVLPPGYVVPASLTSSEPLVCKLNKSLYGLKQAPRQWFCKLSSALLSFGFQQSACDHALFTMTLKGHLVVVLIYVDDILITGANSSAIDEVEALLHSQFKIKDTGSLKYFLGLEISRNSTGICLHQRKYTLDIITDSGLSLAKSSEVPIDQNHGLAMDSGSLISDPNPYRRLVGRLIYLSITRPDIACAVHILSQFMSSPRQPHIDDALKLVRYLKGSIS